jgi:tetratricopeptide (TPR) repeat protein
LHFNFKYILVFLSILSFAEFSYSYSNSSLNCKTNFKKGLEYFDIRNEGATEWRASDVNIKKAISHFEISIKCSEYELESAQMLLRSYHYKAMFTGLTGEESKTLHNKAKVLGDSMMTKYPDDLLVKLWYVVNAGKWVEHYGILRSAYEGMAPKIKNTAHLIASKDSLFIDGVGLRLLGTIYFRAPFIPLILEWPDKDKGIEYSRRAVAISPQNIGNLMFLGRLLHNYGQHEEARIVLTKCVNQEPREAFLMIDRFDQMKAKMFLDEISNIMYD